MWGEKELEVKRKLRYYKDITNPNMEDQKYLFLLTSLKNKINILKIRKKSHELHTKTRRWTIPKTSWVEMTFHLYETTSVEDESHFILECLVYTHIKL